MEQTTQATPRTVEIARRVSEWMQEQIDSGKQGLTLERLLQMEAEDAEAFAQFEAALVRSVQNASKI